LTPVPSHPSIKSGLLINSPATDKWANQSPIKRWITFPVHLNGPARVKVNILCPIMGVNFFAVKAANQMLTILGLKVSYETLAFFALFIASEVVANSKLKENSIAQLFMNAVNSLKPFRTEDDKIKNIKDILK
jgi:hypothetical protein